MAVSDLGRGGATRRAAVLILGATVLLSAAFCKNREEEGPPSDPPPELSSLRPQFDFRGKILFQSDMDGDSEIYVLTAAGVTKLTDNDWQDEYPRCSPDGRRIAFSANPAGRFQIYSMSWEGTDIVQLTQAPHDAMEHAWYPDGKKLAYTIEAPGRDFSMWTLDLESGRTQPLLPDFRGSNALPDFSPAEPLMGFTGKRLIGWDVFLLDLATGRWRELVKGGRSCRPRFSPDGKKIVYVSGEADGKGDIWIMNPDGSGKERLTERDDMYDYFPSWSPDGKYIVFCSDRVGRLDGGRWALFLIKVATRRIFPLFDSGRRDLFPEWH